MSSWGLLALWRRWYRGEGQLTGDTAMFAAALAALNLTGATVSVLWLVLPHAAGAHELPIVCATLGAYALGTFLVVAGRTKPWWLFQVSIALDTLVISVALVATGDPESVYAFYYLWATLYAVCFFRPWQIALQAAWVCTAYAGSLALIGGRPAAGLLAQWLLPMVTLLAAGALVRQLTGRLRRSEAILRHDAGHDHLTRLPNRALFGERLDAALAEPGDAPVAVAFLDLDHFKRVNDSLGHTVGDGLLIAVAERLRAHAPEGATIARFGGDEFLVLLRSPEWEAQARALLDVFAVPLVVGEHVFPVCASAGAAAARPGEDAQALVRQADTALYRAKQEGRARFVAFDERMAADVHRRLQLERDLRAAIARRELAVAYQPIVSLADGAIAGAEALARWTHPELGPIGPDVFIAVAEETALIGLVGERVLETACRDAVRWLAAAPAFYLSVNVSPRQLEAPGFMRGVERALAATGFPAQRLTLEVTETVALSEDAHTRANLLAIERAGIRIALDDFGTGQSSLAHLSRVRADMIKLDRSFISAAPSPAADAIVSAVASIGQATGVRVLAEGIETAEQRARVQRLGCGMGQGWHFGRPVPAAQFGARLRSEATTGAILGAGPES